MPLEDALARLLAVVRALPAAEADRISTFDALGRVLAEDVRSGLDVPPEDNTAMDGYALRCADVPAAGTVLPVSQRIPAGTVGEPLQPGTAARIFTGAQIPRGADSVVMQELCVAVDGGVRVDTVPPPGLSIRRRGEDVRQGAVVLAAGLRLSPPQLGMAAAVGAGALVVARRPRVALFSTGDELAMPGEPLKPGAIYNSNRYTLRALIEALGGECIDLGIVPDRLDATRAALREAAAVSDLIVTCGGVSVGEEDHLRPAVAAEGRIDLWQVALKPGKPLAFGEVRRGGASYEGGHRGDVHHGLARHDDVPYGPARRGDARGFEGGSAWFIGLPGNPVSAFVTFVLAVRPVLLRLQGVTAVEPPAAVQRADFDWPRPDKRREFLRVRRNPAGGLDLFPNQGSGVLASVAWADGLVDNPGGTAIRAGDAVRYLPFAELLS